MRAQIKLVVETLKRFKWTWLRVAVASVIAWAVLLLLFRHGRMCEPFGSPQCSAHFWDYIGDAVWLADVENWQTLITGFIAIVAAFVGGYFINKQITQAAEIERDRRSREFAAARAMLPIYLSNLTQYVQDCAKSLKSLYRLRRFEISAVQSFAVPDFRPVPLEAAHFLQSVILNSREEHRKPFVEILQGLQTFDARLRMMRARYSTAAEAKQATRHGLLDITIQTIELYARIESLFPFSREESDEMPTALEVVERYESVINILGFDGENAPDVLKAVSQRVVRFHEREAKAAASAAMVGKK